MNKQWLIGLSLLSPFCFAQTLQLDTQGLHQFNIEAGSGDLHVKGETGLNQIQVDAKARYHSGEPLEAENYQLTLAAEKGTALLVAQTNPHISNAYIDVVVRMPANLMLDIADGSGDMQVSDIKAAVKIQDGSGDMRVSRIGGEMHINDGSGDIHITQVAGSIEAKDASGEVRMSEIQGDIHLVDASGGIWIQDVQGDIKLFDSSGGIEVDKVTGLVEVEDGSGDIEVNDAQRFVLKRDGSGDVELSNIRER